MTNARHGIEVEHQYAQALGGHSRVLDTPFGQRQVDVLIPTGGRAVQVKTGKEYLTTTGRHANSLSIQKDAWLVQQGYEVQWILEQGGSAPLLDALRKAGIGVHLGPL